MQKRLGSQEPTTTAPQQAMSSRRPHAGAGAGAAVGVDDGGYGDAKKTLSAGKARREGKRTLKFTGADHLRQRVACCVLSQRAVTISDIRPHDAEPGLLDHEVSLLRLVDKLSSGSRIDINETGTQVHLRPGWVAGGTVKHDCGTARGIGYFIEGIIHMCLFAKKPVRATFTGVTDSPLDSSINHLYAGLKPVLRAFGVDTTNFSMYIKRRGLQPGGGGEVSFTCPNVRELAAINLCEAGFVKKVRGTAYTAKVSPQVGNRVITAARALFMKLLPDVRIATDARRGRESGESPGFGVTLVARTTSGCCKAVEVAGGRGSLPEEVGKRVSELLCEEIAHGGCVDSTIQPLLPLMMILTSEDVSKVRLGPLTPYTVEVLRHIDAFLGARFKVAEDKDTASVTLSCLGLGYKNYGMKVT